MDVEFFGNLHNQSYLFDCYSVVADVFSHHLIHRDCILFSVRVEGMTIFQIHFRMNNWKFQLSCWIVNFERCEECSVLYVKMFDFWMTSFLKQFLSILAHFEPEIHYSFGLACDNHPKIIRMSVVIFLCHSRVNIILNQFLSAYSFPNKSFWHVFNATTAQHPSNQF